MLKRHEILALRTNRITIVWWHHPDHGVGPQRKQNFAANDIRIAIKVALPRFVSENDDARLVLFFLARKTAAEKGRHIQNPKNIRSHGDAKQLARVVAGAEHSGSAGERHKAFARLPPR